MTNVSAKPGFILLILMSVSYLFHSCKTKIYSREEKEFTRYLKETFNKDPVNNEESIAYYIINMRECEDCIHQHLLAIRACTFKTNIVLVIVGKVARKEWQDILAEVIKRGDHVLIDERGNGLLYDFGLVKPIILKFESGRLVDLIRIADREIPIIISKL
jgi:hypothetical protein